MILALVIHDAPLGKGRPRVNFGARRTFTPTRTAHWEARAASEIAAQIPAGWRPATEPVRLVVDAVFPRPLGMRCSHKRACSCREDGRLERQPHVSSPDADNVLKAVCDALQKGGALDDDRVVWDARCRKWIAAQDEAPAVYVEMATLAIAVAAARGL